MRRVYICIPVHNRVNYTIECIESILNQNYENYKIIITDDGSNDGTSEVLTNRYPEIVVLKGDGNLWWAGATNKCVDYVLDVAQNDDYIFTLNNDTRLQKNTINVLLKHAQIFNNSIIGAVNVFESDPLLIEPSAEKKRRIMGLDFYRRVNNWGEVVSKYCGIVEVDLLYGKGVLIPVSIFKSIGLYNSHLLPHYHADIEFTFRAKRYGHRIFLCYDAKVLSHQALTGLGTRASKPKIKDFLKSFFTIKSTHHLNSLINRNKLIFGNRFWIHFFISLSGIILGFIKRSTYEKIISIRNNSKAL